MKIVCGAYLTFILFLACADSRSNKPKLPTILPNQIVDHINANGKIISDRFRPPGNYIRKEHDAGSFQAYLSSLALKPHGSLVQYYNGSFKSNNGIYLAVVDLPIGKEDLHQCADAVIRLRADYFWENGLFDRIHFNFTNGFNVEYSRWRAGNRIMVKGNDSWWEKKTDPSNTYEDYWKYLETIFRYAGTYSLSKEMIPIGMDEINVGDVFIQGGFPGHAIIVVDMAYNPETNHKVFILAQSYMPAQELQILNNPANGEDNPWYDFDQKETIITPEWKFTRSDLKRFN